MGQEAKKKKINNDLIVRNKQKFDISKFHPKVQSILGDLKNRKGNVNHSEVIDTLLEKGYVDEKEIVQIFSKEFNIEAIENLEEYKISKELLELIPRRICERHVLVPLTKIDKTLVVVFSDPSNIHIIDNLSLLTGCKIQSVVACKSDIKNVLSKCYNNQKKLDSLFYDMDIENFGFEDEKAVNLDKEEEKQQSNPVISFVNLIFSDAIRLKSSDIHLEVYENSFRIRYRVDGALHEKHVLPKDMAPAIISRIKVMSNMDISEKRKPQDARLKIRLDSKELNMRVNSTPTVNGEKIVLRILDDSSLKVDMSLLGMENFQLKMFIEALQKPQGLILMTGPTGSGKTTTIYSGLMKLNTPDRNISTAEDPVEFRIHGINQVQMNQKIGLDFSVALRAFLRQDPDIILVGEIRDIETAEIAFKASSTGHLVLSTLHTNDTASTVTRLLSMGVPSYSVADNTSIIISQRLLRLLCNKCKRPIHEKDLVNLEKLGIPKEDLSLYTIENVYDKGSGCSFCNNLGYNGRIAVYEMMKITPKIKEAIFDDLPPMELKKIAIQDGMITLRHSALTKLKEGLVNIEEVIRSTMFDN